MGVGGSFRPTRQNRDFDFKTPDESGV